MPKRKPEKKIVKQKPLGVSIEVKRDARRVFRMKAVEYDNTYTEFIQKVVNELGENHPELIDQILKG